MTRRFSAALLGLALVALSFATPADAQTGRSQDDLPSSFAMFTITNDTPDVTITYKMRWGKGNWRQVTLQPGQGERHWCRMNDAGKAPTPHVSFDYVVNGRGTRSYRLVPTAVTFGQAGTFGSPTPYSFQYAGNGNFIDLFLVQ